MENFNKEKKYSGNRSGNRGFGQGRDGSNRKMYKVICSDCGKNCEIPFRPTGDKPVFCSDCFKNKGDNNSRNFRGGSNREHGKRNSQSQFDDKRSHQNNGGRNAENYKVQFEQLNTKLDKILRVLIPAVSEEIKETEALKSKNFQKTPKKETDTTALKNIITKTMDKNLTAKKVADKKTATKKSVAKKKGAGKKTAAKKKKQ